MRCYRGIGMRKYWRSVLGISALLVIRLSGTPAPDSFRFVILGDRTGEARPGVYEQVWREVAEEDPAFVLSVGDTIQGLNDATAEAEWRAVQQILTPYKRFPLYLAPGNHDIWSEQSEKLFRQYAGRAVHYSFDHGPAHFTILDNSRSDEMPEEELAFLEKDLQAHEKQPVKFIVSHRPSWLIPAAFVNRDFPLHKLAKKYGVEYVIAGHVHQLLHVDLDGVTYLSMESGRMAISERRRNTKTVGSSDRRWWTCAGRR